MLYIKDKKNIQKTKQHNETKINNLPDEKFKVIVIS